MGVICNQLLLVAICTIILVICMLHGSRAIIRMALRTTHKDVNSLNYIGLSTSRDETVNFNADLIIEC